MPPKVSVVVPSYNNAAFVEATVKSILCQTLDDFELLISDHSSTDGTWGLLQQFAADPRVRLHQVSAGGGAERNWNHVTGLAQGELLKLVCADDLLHPTCLEEQVAALEAAGPAAALLASKRDVVDAAGRVMVPRRGLGRLAGRVAPGEVARAVVRAGTNLLGEPGCVLFRRERLVEAGGWDGRDGYVIDLRTYLNVIDRGDLIALPRSLAAFRVTTTQWSARLRHEQASQVESLLEEIGERWPGYVSPRDLARGRRAARLQEAQRRVIYKILGWRGSRLDPDVASA